MIALRRKTRETLRHERAVVLQELATPTAAAVQQDIATNQARAAELRRDAQRGDGHREPSLGLVTKTVAGGNGIPEKPCPYCGLVGGHTGQCPVVS